VILFFIGLALLLFAAVAALVISHDVARDRVFTTLVVAGSGVASVPAFRVLTGSSNVTASWTSDMPGGAWAIGIDPLSAVFLLFILVVGASSAAFGTAYMRASEDRAKTRRAHAAFAGLLIALAVVVTAQSVLLFLAAWEIMAIVSFLLIITEHRREQVRRAGFIYLVATHTGTLILFVMFAVWARTSGDWSFATLAAARPTLAWGGGPLFVLALAGFGVKAGFVPFHFWLPSAHAGAPSHVSAIMSGVVIKTGIYGILRIILLAGPLPAWWGWTVLALGVLSALLGVLWALAQHDIKRLLAYHSIENIGIILMGLGLGVLGTAYHHPILSILGYGAAILHTVNHALFKALLFMSAGATYRMTGTNNLEDLGGLARRMPTTFVLFLIGSIAIIGVPPLNGFISEWLVFQGLFRASIASGTLRLALFGAPALALVGGLALACFAKAAGVIFLGKPRSDRPLAAREVSRAFLVPQVALAAACVAIGLLPGIIVPPLFRVAATIAHDSSYQTSPVLHSVLIDAQRLAVFGAILLIASVVAYVGRQLISRRRLMRSGPTWSGAYAETTPRMQYTASSFAAPLLSVFGGLTGVREHRGGTVYHSTPHDLVLERVVVPSWRRVQRAALRLRPMQQGRLHFYLLYVVAALVAVLTYLMLTS
jgi:hydrogenase-4 component B